MTIDLIEPPPATAIAEYSRTSAAVAELKRRLANVFYDLSSTKGMEVAKKDRAELRGLRTALEAKRVELKAPALERSRLIDAEAKALTAELVALEKPIDEQIKAEESRKAVEKAAREQVEREKAAKVQQCIDAIRESVAHAFGKSAEHIAKFILLSEDIEITLEEFGDRAGEAAQVKAKLLTQLREMHAAVVAHEAEKARMAAEAAELVRLRAEQEARDAAERKKLADEELAAKAARDKADAEARAVRDEQDRIAREARAVEDKRLADARAALEAEQRAARQAEEAKAAAARKVEQDRLDAIAKQEREAAAAEQKRLDEEAAARRAEADRIAAEARAKAEAAHAAEQRQRNAAPAMHDALRQWRAAEETGDADELQNARAARDEVLAALEGEPA